MYHLLTNNAAYDDVAAIVKASDFYAVAHRCVFDIVGRLVTTGQVADIVTVAAAARESGVIDDIGGYVYLVELKEQWTTHDAARHAQIVREYAIRRQLIEAARDTEAEAFAGHDDTQTILEAAERRILAVSETGSQGQTVSAEQAGSEAKAVLDDRTERYDRGAPIGVTTGFERFDTATGGFQPGELCVIAARTSVGKTAFSLNITAAACRGDIPVAFASLEQSRTELLLRLWCMTAGIDSWRMRKGGLHATEKQAIAQARRETDAWPLAILDGAGQTMARIAANARRLKRQGKLGLLVIDYLGLVEPEDKRAPRQEQVALITRRAKGLAKDLAVPVLALCQLNREADGERPRLANLRESGAIEQDADTVILLHREGERNPDTVPPEFENILVDVAKQRNGPTCAWNMRYRAAHFRFVDKTEF